MKVVLLRVGIDSGTGGIQGPLFPDGTFEYLPIAGGHTDGPETYGNTVGRCGRKLIDFFPTNRRDSMRDRLMHFDPEFDTFTYGDPTSPKAKLRELARGDLLVFYCGLEGYGFRCDPALHIMGYFEIEKAGLVTELDSNQVASLFWNNAHVRNINRFKNDCLSLVLVKGTSESRLLKKAYKISCYGKDKSGDRIKVLSPDAQEIFGDFGGKIAIQRSPPRWVAPRYVAASAAFVRSLE